MPLSFAKCDAILIEQFTCYMQLAGCKCNSLVLLTLELHFAVQTLIDDICEVQLFYWCPINLFELARSRFGTNIVDKCFCRAHSFAFCIPFDLQNLWGAFEHVIWQDVAFHVPKRRSCFQVANLGSKLTLAPISEQISDHLGLFKDVEANTFQKMYGQDGIAWLFRDKVKLYANTDGGSWLCCPRWSRSYRRRSG